MEEGGVCLDLMNLQLVQRGKRLIAVEVGWGGCLKESDTKGLSQVRDEMGKDEQGCIDWITQQSI